MKHDWSTLYGSSNIELIEEKAWRIVEDQTRSSTRKMVDTQREHELLEKMLENNKPKLKYYGDELAFEGLHYLLSTPFRYPPLMNGTRFGHRFERNLFYAALELKTAMCEKAYHRLDFLLASEGEIGGKSINCTAFKVNIFTKMGLDFRKPPFLDLKNEISSPISYQISQSLGTHMRKEGVAAFISYSARSQENGCNINIFTPKAFGKNGSLESSFQAYTCYSTKKSVEFYSNLSRDEPTVFNVENFYVNNHFPSIAV